MKKVFTKRLISAILTTALIGTSAFALFGCGKASKDTSNDAKVHITNVSAIPSASSMFPMTPPESCIPNIIRFLQSIGKNRPDRM